MRPKTAVLATMLVLLASTLAACQSDGSSASDSRADEGSAAGDAAGSGRADTGAGDAAAAGRLRRLLITDRRTGARAVSRYLIGGNQRWLKNADGVWTRHGLNDRISTLSDNIGVQSVRYPGGTVANMFNYARMTGIRPAGCQTSGGFAEDWFVGLPKSDTQYTIQRHADFMTSLHGSPRTSLLVPMINESPKRAVAFVTAMAKATGQKTWTVEIGNEPYLTNQRYWRSKDRDRRLQQYIFGGHQQQKAFKSDPEYHGNQRLYPVTACDLRPGTANRTDNRGRKYRVRFGPISVQKGRRPVIHTDDGRRFRWVRRLAGHTGRVFTTRGATVIFREGTKVTGRHLHINYTAGHEPGFVDFYRHLRSLDKRRHDLHINVCSSWAKPEFVSAMKRLAAAHPTKARYDCLAVHSYSSPKAKHLPRARTQLNAAAHDLTGTLRHLRGGMRSGSQPNSRFLIVTEYGVLNPTIAKIGKTFLYDLYLAQLNMGQIRTGVHVATVSNFGTLFRHDKRGYHLTGRALVQRLYRRMVGQHPVTVRTTGRKGVRILGAKGKHGYQLMVVNSRPSGGLHRRLAVAGSNRNRCIVTRRLSAHLGSTSVPTLHTASTAWRAGTVARVSAPAHSLTLVSITPKGRDGCP